MEHSIKNNPDEYLRRYSLNPKRIEPIEEDQVIDIPEVYKRAKIDARWYMNFDLGESNLKDNETL